MATSTGTGLTGKVSRRTALKTGLVAAFGLPFLPVQAGTNQVAALPADSAFKTMPDLLTLIRDPVLDQALYHSPRLRDPEIAPGGAISVNARWEKGEAAVWFIELQRYAGDLIQAGIGANDLSLVQSALPAIRWGFARQGPDGDFPGTGAAFHSTEIFVADIARGLSLLKQSGLAQFAGVVKEFTPRLQSAARWLARPDISEMGRTQNAPFTHRNYILAMALGTTAGLAGDAELSAAAEACARRGLQLQRADGVNPEKAGFDVNYQSAGLLYASRYYPSCPHGALRGELAGMLQKGAGWLRGRVGNDGNLEVAGSTRVGGQEKQRWGKTKSINYMEVLQAFCFAGTITGDDAFRQTAKLIAHAHSPIGPDELA
ncbi:MAG: hypothetical protein P4N60_07095 [Verrucomicrobiae bacterium]|nr:hypothetical protein [Verrucomicrobiae bacterium]